MVAATRRRSRRQGSRTTVSLVAAEPSRRSALAALIQKIVSGVFVEATTQLAFASGRRPSTNPPDIVVADIESPSSAASMSQFLREGFSGVGAIALIDDPDPRWVQAALRGGINAIISRDPGAEELRLALAAADAGLVLLYPASANALLPSILQPSDLAYEPERLTAREFEVLRLLSEGLGNKEIAARLAISDHTAKSHISSILGKMGVASRTEAVSQGIRKGLIPI